MSLHSLALEVAIENFALKQPFRITGYIQVNAEVVTVHLRANGFVGRGEASGVYYRKGEDVSGLVGQIEAVRKEIEKGISREALQQLLPPGGARNAIDCALWDLEAKTGNKSAWEMAGLEEPRPLVTTFTCPAADPDVMASTALRDVHAKALKLKLIGDPIDAERVQAVYSARPDVWLGVDANQGFTLACLKDLMPTLVRANVKLIEQPFKVGQEAFLDGLNSPIAVASDESVQSRAQLRSQIGRVNVVNIKLDKCGGLTEALAMAHEARSLGLEVMVGNMIGTSLAMAPAFLVGQLCDVVDLDGPIFLESDRRPSLQYGQGSIRCPLSLWGGVDESPT